MLTLEQRIIKNKLATTKFVSDTKKIVAEHQTIQTSDLNQIRWLGEQTIQSLFNIWVKTKSQLEDFDIEEIKKVVTPLWFKNISLYLNK